MSERDTEHVEPVKHVEPVEPVEPVEQTEPTASVEPVGGAASPAQQQPRPADPYALASVVASLFGLAFPLAALLGIGLGVYVLRRASRAGDPAPGLAKLGLGIGVVVVVLTIAAVVAKL